MDTKKVLNKLVTGKFISGFDYRRKFTFKTVYHKSACSYCICKCGFQHEFLGYISEPTEIENNVYGEVVKCILAGKCPHVDEVPENYVRESSISAYSIAAAVGTAAAFTTDTGPIAESPVGIFKLTPIQMAIMKNPGMIPYVLEVDMSKKQTILDVKRMKEELGDFVHFEELNVVDYCARKREISAGEMFNMIGATGIDYVAAGQAAFKYNNIELLEMLKKRWRRQTKPEVILEEFCTLAIIYDKSELLHFLLHQADLFERRGTLKCSIHMAGNLHKVCDALQRHECKQALLIKQNFLTSKRFDLPSPSLQKAMEDKELIKLIRIAVLTHILIKYNLTETILPILRATPDVARLLDESKEEYGTILHAYNCSHYGPDPLLLREILDLHVDINLPDRHGMPPLIQLLHMKEFLFVSPFRVSEELYVFENPSVWKHQSAVVRAIRIDKICERMFEKPPSSVKYLRKDYITDVKQHGMQGHDGDNMPLNFMAPFLIECGFPVLYDFIEEFEDLQDDINPIEQLFIAQYLETPRPLLLQCRDRLRTHYKGRQIHKFVEMVNIPQTMKDFILLKPLLKCVPKHLLR